MVSSFINCFSFCFVDVLIHILQIEYGEIVEIRCIAVSQISKLAVLLLSAVTANKALLGKFSSQTGITGSGVVPCIIAGSRYFTVNTVDSQSSETGVFTASSYLTNWTGTWSQLGPISSIRMQVFNNTICTGSFGLIDTSNSGVLDLTCVFYRENGDIETTCQVSYINTGFSFYTNVLIWNIITTVGFVLFFFTAFFLLWMYQRDKLAWRQRLAAFAQQDERVPSVVDAGERTRLLSPSSSGAVGTHTSPSSDLGRAVSRPSSRTSNFAIQ
jgi:hypothetical protein